MTKSFRRSSLVILGVLLICWIQKSKSSTPPNTLGMQISFYDQNGQKENSSSSDNVTVDDWEVEALQEQKNASSETHVKNQDSKLGSKTEPNSFQPDSENGNHGKYVESTARRIDDEDFMYDIEDLGDKITNALKNFKPSMTVTKGNSSQKESVIQRFSSIRKSREENNTQNKSDNVFPKLSDFENLLEIFNPYLLSKEWNNLESESLTKKCKRNMESYFAQLQRGTTWALKMWDASGHYSGGYFWGNHYWLGSKTSCEEIKNNEADLSFELGFNIARIQLTLQTFVNEGNTKDKSDGLSSFTSKGNQYVGICLPYSCSKDDVHTMVDHVLSSNPVKNERRTLLLKVKSPHDFYNIFEDPLFWVLLLSWCAVCVAIAIGTRVEMKIRRRKNSFEYTYAYAVNPIVITPPRTDVNGDRVKVSMTEQSSGTPDSKSNNSSGARTPSIVLKNDFIIPKSNWEKIMLSFSLTRNLKQICDGTIGEDTISTVHGLRSLSMVWVILGHTCIVAYKYSDNQEYRKLNEKVLLYQAIDKGPFSVDTFFFISGLLVSFLYFRTTVKVNVNKITKTTGFISHSIEFFGLIMYRFLRLTAPYFFTLGVVSVCMKWFYYNSVFDPPTDDHLNCPNYWWRNVLYINTLFPVKEMCTLWSWYLADDTQFYTLGIVLLIVAVHGHFKVASVSVIVLLISSWLTTGYVAFVNNHMPNVDDPLALFDKIYDKPWTRFGPYLIGMIVGWFLFKTGGKLSMKRRTVAFGWVCCTALMLYLIFGLHNTDLSAFAAACYSSLSHSAWALGLSWIVIACSTGHGGLMNKLLSSKLLIPFSRTTYCAYLIHPIVMRAAVMRQDSPVHLSVENIGLMFLGQLVLSYVIAIILSVTLEAPIVSLLKLISPTKKRNS